MTDEQVYLIIAEIRGLREIVERALDPEGLAGAKEGKGNKKRRRPSPDYVTVDEVATYCCVSTSTVSRGVRDHTWPFNLLRHLHIGKRVIFSRGSFLYMCRIMKRAAEGPAAH